MPDFTERATSHEAAQCCAPYGGREALRHEGMSPSMPPLPQQWHSPSVSHSRSGAGRTTCGVDINCSAHLTPIPCPPTESQPLKFPSGKSPPPPPRLLPDCVVLRAPGCPGVSPGPGRSEPCRPLGHTEVSGREHDPSQPSGSQPHTYREGPHRGHVAWSCWHGESPAEDAGGAELRDGGD